MEVIESEKQLEEKEGKLANATVNLLTDPAQTGMVFTNAVDVMEMPTEYKKLIETCRFFYKHDPIAGTIINKMVDFAVSPMINQQANCTDSEYVVYESLKPMLEEFFRNVCLEYLLSGLVVPHYEWEKMSGAKLSPELNSRTRFWIPNNIWFRDPATVTIKSTIIPNKKEFYVKVDSETVRFIKSGGKRRDGTFDKETYQAFIENYPEFVKMIRANRGTTPPELLLPEVRPILGRCLPESPYPVPYMSNSLESLMHKRNIRRMDYSIAARVIAAIQLIKLGSDEFPTKDPADFEFIKSQMNYRTARGQSERLFQLFANHTVTIEWVTPDTAAMLSRDKYSAVDDDIISGFGFPRTLITGETIRSNVEGGSDLASFSPIATLESIREKLVAWTVELYDEVKTKNRFKGAPKPAFRPMRLYSLTDLNDITRDLYEEGSLSRKTRLELQGHDQETELERIAKEDEEYKEKDIREAPFIPFSSPGGGFNRNTQQPQQPKETQDTQR